MSTLTVKSGCSELGANREGAFALDFSVIASSHRLRGAFTIERALIVLLTTWSCASSAQGIAISNPEQHTENRSWNEAGVAPVYQILVSVSVVPSGLPTLVFAERGNERHPLTYLPGTAAPDRYVLLLRFEQARAESWRVLAERGEARSAPVSTRAVAKPWQVPFAQSVRVTGQAASPRVSWSLPDLAGRKIERIRVGVRGGQRAQGRYMDVLFVSQALPPTTTSFDIPQGILAAGERYIFQVMLENLEGGELKNRSLTFSEPHTVGQR